MFCQRCGREIPNNAILCPFCNFSTGKYNDTVPIINETKPKKKLYKRVWFWAIVVVVLLSISKLNKRVNTNIDVQPEDSVSISNNQSVATSTQQNTKKTTVNTNNIANYYLELKSAKLTYRDNTPYLVVNYIFTNNSDENRSFDTAITCTAFQDGIECNTVYYTGGIQGFDIQLGRKELQPGKSLEVQDVYGLNDTTTPVEIQVTLFSIWSDKVYKTFTVNLSNK